MASNTIRWTYEQLDNAISRSEPIGKTREDNFNAIIPDDFLDFADHLMDQPFQMKLIHPL